MGGWQISSDAEEEVDGTPRSEGITRVGLSGTREKHLLGAVAFIVKRTLQGTLRGQRASPLLLPKSCRSGIDCGEING